MKIKPSKVQLIIELITILLLVAMVVNLKLSWNNITDQVPGHYNISGEIDRWGSKPELLTVPILCGVLYILLSLVSLFPSLWNLPGSINDGNRTKVLGSIKNMMSIMKMEMVLCFVYISYRSVKMEALSPYFTMVCLGVLVLTIVYYFIKTVKVSK